MRLSAFPSPPSRLAAVAVALATTLAHGAADTPLRWKLAFDPDAAHDGFTAVAASAAYTSERGYGFEAGTAMKPDGPSFFSVRVSEGNYQVTAVLGDAHRAGLTTIKAELRRLMVEHVATAPGEFKTIRFIVNVRTPAIAAVDGIKAGAVKLKAPRETEQEAWAWDEKLTLEFNDEHPAVRSLEIEPVAVPTLFVLGDSTVCDQSREPYASWGQMLTRFFQPTIAIANHGESGESYSSSLSRRRIDKIASTLRPGDAVLLQFGHNDQKERGPGAGPFLNYKTNIQRHIALVRGRGGIPVVVSPMERRDFDPQGKLRPSLNDYAEAARQAARENDCAFIDLHAVSIPFYEALEAHGTDYSRRAFAGQDNTHHNNYGAYELAQAVAQGLRDANLAVAKYLREDFRGFDPKAPDPVEAFDVPASPGLEGPKPLGN